MKRHWLWKANRFCTAALAFALLLGMAAGCGGQIGHSGENGLSTNAGTGAHGSDDVPDGANGPAGGEETGETPDGDGGGNAAGTKDGDGKPPGDPEGEPDAASGETVNTHYMNKNYFLKPIDENGEKRVVLLTFDDGPKEEGMLTDILDTLDRHGAKAVFFVNGFRVRQNPDLLRLIDERGHAIGNHSYDHIVLKNEPEDVIDAQLEGVQDIVEQTVGKRPRFFRPPNGAGNDYVKAKAAELGMLYMTWSNGSLDWADNKNDPDGVIRSVMEQLHPGCIILMHELPWTAEALDELLSRIEAEGYAFLDPEAIDPEMR
jgi:peptidoglycan/xylan/chitin deacetylase (PgdA/CDA1 family)